MTDDVDRILASEGLVTPTTGFVNRVMAAVRRSREDVRPIPFPWARFAAGLFVGLVCALATAAILLKAAVPWPPLRGAHQAVSIVPWISVTGVFGAAAAILSSLVAVRLAIEFASE